MRRSVCSKQCSGKSAEGHFPDRATIAGMACRISVAISARGGKVVLVKIGAVTRLLAAIPIGL
jgi:hypothetical protein